MILNGYSMLDGFLVALRGPLGLAVLTVALLQWRRFTRDGVSDHLEQRYHLLTLLALLLVGLNLVGWPLLYLVLQSYVPQWPGVMCMYGVTRIGAGSEGPSAYLPNLVTTLQILKPSILFLCGAWATFHMVNRRTARSNLLAPTLVFLALLGVASLADAAVEATYLLIPKSEKFLAVGCCTAAVSDLERASRFVPSGLLGQESRHWIQAAFVGLTAGIPLGLIVARFRVAGGWLLIPLAAAVAAIPVGLMFLVDVASPAILRLPYHHCPYDLIAAAPETTLGVASLLLGVYSVGWACLTAWLAGGSLPSAEVRLATERLLFVTATSFAVSLVLFATELILA